MRLWEAVAKRALDIIVSGVALLLLSPLFFLIALAVRFTSPGPALFRQTRVGKDGKPFTCYKFRTMYVDAPDIRNPDGSTFNAEYAEHVIQAGPSPGRSTLGD